MADIKDRAREYLAEHSVYSKVYRQSFVAVDLLTAMVEFAEQETKELKKNYEDSLVACGVLKNKVDLLAQPSPLESMQDVLIATQKIANEKQRERIINLESQIEKMKCCANCRHSRTEYEHCRTNKHEKWEMEND